LKSTYFEQNQTPSFCLNHIETEIYHLWWPWSLFVEAY